MVAESAALLKLYLHGKAGVAALEHYLLKCEREFTATTSCTIYYNFITGNDNFATTIFNDNLLFDNGTAPKATPRAGVLMTRDEEDGHY